MTSGFDQQRRPRQVRRGQEIRARDQQEKRDALIQAFQRARNSLFVQRAQPWAHSMLHEITAIQDDYLECVRIWRGGTQGAATVFVAKPKRLRNELSRDGVTYVYADFQTRTASKSGETDETQRVTPVYLVGDFIEVEVSRGLTGITEVDEQRGHPIDKNVDGRAWAAEPPP